jgi:hypothetical protein
MHFVTVGNHGFIKFLKNLCLNFQQDFMRNHELIVFCLGEKCYAELQSFKNFKKIKNVKLIHKSYENDKHLKYSGNKNFKKNPEFVELNNLKLSLVSDVIKNFDVIHYIDADIGFLKDPQSEYDKLNGYDLVFQSDVIDGSLYFPNQCAGNFLIRNNVNARDVIMRACDLCSVTVVDQQALNKILSSEGCEDIRKFRFANLTSFDPYKFPNGFNAFYRLQYKRSELVCLHANYLSGESSKIDALAEGGVWYLDGFAVLFFRKTRFLIRYYYIILKKFLKRILFP